MSRRPPPPEQKPPLAFRVAITFFFYFALLGTLYWFEFEIPEEPTRLERLGILSVYFGPILIVLGFIFERRK